MPSQGPRKPYLQPYTVFLLVLSIFLTASTIVVSVSTRRDRIRCFFALTANVNAVFSSCLAAVTILVSSNKGALQEGGVSYETVMKTNNVYGHNEYGFRLNLFGPAEISLHRSLHYCVVEAIGSAAIFS